MMMSFNTNLITTVTMFSTSMIVVRFSYHSDSLQSYKSHLRNIQNISLCWYVSFRPRYLLEYTAEMGL